MRQGTRRSGFTLLELLVVVAIIGIIAAITFFTLISARNRAQDRSAETYASSVFKVAFAHITEDATNPVVVDLDCSDGYIAGGFDVAAPNGAVTSCAVSAAVDGTPLIQVESINGRIIVLPN